MELKCKCQPHERINLLTLLIAPLMELKLDKVELRLAYFCTFNRTAYGIEILSGLLRPISGWTFNRTAYGIEMPMIGWWIIYYSLLIAPLMELKYSMIYCISPSTITFNRTAYGIEIVNWTSPRP